MKTTVTRWVFYGAPWNFSTHKDAVPINVLEPDIAVNCHIPVELLAQRHLNTEALSKRAQEEK